MKSDSCLTVIAGAIVVIGSMVWWVHAQTVEAKWDSELAVNVQVAQTQSVSSSSASTTVNENAPYPWCVEQLFKISGYYSPKPDQKIYNRDTYEAEITLNGRGVHGASGMPVFNGMIAAPKSYAFGTVIVLPWLGIGQVQDRWWAIINSDWYDRIDVWLGEWDEWLHRARSVGLRRVVGWYCPGSATKDIWFNREAIPHYTNFTQVAFWWTDQNIGRSGPLVSLGQEYLRKLWYLSNDVLPGVYNQQMRDLVCRFQIEQLWLGGSEDYCGALGPQTRSKIKALLIKKWILSDTNIYALDNASSLSRLFTQPNIRPAWNYQVEPTLAPAVTPSPVSESIDMNATKVTFTRAIEVGETSTDVVVLQKILAKEKVFDHDVTWYFWPVTKDALTQFQLKYQLIDSRSHLAAGHMWPATRDLLNKKQKLLVMKALDR